jgi:hypothetical protein
VPKTAVGSRIFGSGCHAERDVLGPKCVNETYLSAAYPRVLLHEVLSKQPKLTENRVASSLRQTALPYARRRAGLRAHWNGVTWGSSHPAARRATRMR